MSENFILSVRILRSEKDWNIDNDDYLVDKLNTAISTAIEYALIKIIDRGLGFVDEFVSQCIGDAVTRFVIPITNSEEIIKNARTFIFKYFGKSDSVYW